MANIKYYGDLRELTGKESDELITDSLKGLLDLIGRLYGGKAKKAAKSSLIVVDSEKVLSIKKVPLSESSEVGFFPMCGGG